MSPDDALGWEVLKISNLLSKLCFSAADSIFSAVNIISRHTKRLNVFFFLIISGQLSKFRHSNMRCICPIDGLLIIKSKQYHKRISFFFTIKVLYILKHLIQVLSSNSHHHAAPATLNIFPFVA